MALNLEKQLLFYGAYHSNPVCAAIDPDVQPVAHQVNVAIHITCVPVLLYTGIVLASNSPALFTLPEALQYEHLPANLGTIGGFIYAVFYILLEPVAGGLIAPVIIAGSASANHLLSTYGPSVNYWAGWIHVLSWVAQFIGHGAFEGRAPALLDNLVQAFLLAPLFVWMEVLFFLGYRPELRARYHKSVEKEIATFRANGKAAQ